MEGVCYGASLRDPNNYEQFSRAAQEAVAGVLGGYKGSVAQIKRFEIILPSQPRGSDLYWLYADLVYQL